MPRRTGPTHRVRQHTAQPIVLRLPNELLCHVLTGLPISSCISASHVCRTWRSTVISNSDLWTRPAVRISTSATTTVMNDIDFSYKNTVIAAVETANFTWTADMEEQAMQDHAVFLPKQMPSDPRPLRTAEALAACFTRSRTRALSVGFCIYASAQTGALDPYIAILEQHKKHLSQLFIFFVDTRHSIRILSSITELPNLTTLGLFNPVDYSIDHQLAYGTHQIFEQTAVLLNNIDVYFDDIVGSTHDPSQFCPQLQHMHLSRRYMSRVIPTEPYQPTFKFDQLTNVDVCLGEEFDLLALLAHLPRLRVLIVRLQFFSPGGPPTIDAEDLEGVHGALCYTRSVTIHGANTGHTRFVFPVLELPHLSHYTVHFAPNGIHDTPMPPHWQR
ncbi:hypothetical protein BKA62DRAFT_261131 [Auriculariales sp. MPI-PUGE-AT-0066]|nr:hypothetical protein BKA62DRAFT_261131 [Auriculariales sp. MPI-PUGE-AT-0066]